MNDGQVLGIDVALLSGIAFFLLGALLSIYFWFNPRQIRGRIRYKASKDLTFLTNIWKYSDDPIFFDVWNPSAAGLDGKDIREPLKLEFPNTLVVRAAVVLKTAGGLDSSRIRITGTDSNILTVSWAFLDPGMAFQLRILLAPANDEHSVDLARPLRSAGRGWLTVSGRFKGFVLEEPMDLEDLPDRFRSAAGIGCAVFVAYWVCYLLLRAYDLLGSPSFLSENIYARSAAIIVLSAVLWPAAVFSMLGLDSATKFLLNTKSPIDRMKVRAPEVRSLTVGEHSS